MDKCGYPNNEGFFATLKSFGYAKCAFDRFSSKWQKRLGFFSSVNQGEKAADAKVLTLSGVEKSLLPDYILKTPPGQPIVLNFGSYT